MEVGADSFSGTENTKNIRLETLKILLYKYVLQKCVVFSDRKGEELIVMSQHHSFLTPLSPFFLR
jgi:hypothetical protein